MTTTSPSSKLNYQKLSAELRADGQVLTWPAANGNTNGIILDQRGPHHYHRRRLVRGGQRGLLGYQLHPRPEHRQGHQMVKFPSTLPTNGTYEVDAWWVPASNRATNVPYDIVHAAGTTRVLVNQVRQQQRLVSSC